MKNMFKFWGIIAFAAVIVFSMIGCGEDNSGDKNNQTGNNNQPGDGSINFSDAKWSNIDVIANINGTTNPYNSSNKTFTKVFHEFSEYGGGEKSFFEISSNPADWNIKIENNKLSVSLGNPDKAAHSSYIPESINTDGLKVVVLIGFEDDNGNTLHMVDINTGNCILFAYADKAGIISGSANQTNFNLNLKAGWNTIIYTFADMTTGVPGSNFKWVYSGDDGGNNGSINFSDAKWRDIDVFTVTWEDGVPPSSNPYNGGNKNFTKVRPLFLDVEGKESFSAVSNNPTEWNINIANNKLSVALGTPDKVSPSTIIPDNLKTPADLKVVLYQGFEDGNDAISLYDLDTYAITIFVYADKAGIISGSIEGYNINNINMDLKAGWNTAIYMLDRLTSTVTLTTGVPGSNFKWCVLVGEGGNDGDGSIDFSDAKWSNIEVYKYNNSGNTLYNGSDKTFTKVRYTKRYTNNEETRYSINEETLFSEISTYPAAWNVKVVNNKLSVALGLPDKAAHSDLIPDSINLNGLKVFLISGFFDDNGNPLFTLVDNNTTTAAVWFAYADKAGIVSGIYNYTDNYNNNITQNFNLNLKAGWNMAINMQDNTSSDTMTMTTEVPSSNYKWIYYGN